MKRIVFFGTYNPSYPRARYIRACLESLGVDIRSINDRSPGISKYVRLYWQLRFLRDYDAVYVGFPGHAAMLVARAATKKPIIFDAFISLYDTYVFDRERVSKRSVRARFYRWLDRIACRKATMVLVDTPQHADYFSQTFSVPKEVLIAIDAMADLTMFKQRPVEKHERCVVYWHGKYSPFHNVEHIVRAAALLSPERYEFRLLGSGGNRPAIEALVASLRLSHVRFLPSVAYESLADSVAEADLCLGVFGAVEKVDRVVPNKVYEYMASGKLVITKRSQACASLLSGAEITYVGDDPADLATAIEHAYDRYGMGYTSTVNRSIVESRDVQARTVIERLFLGV